MDIALFLSLVGIVVGGTTCIGMTISIALDLRDDFRNRRELSDDQS